MAAKDLKLLPTHEKVIYLKAMIDKSTPPKSTVNLLQIRRDQIVEDSVMQFKTFENPRYQLQIQFMNEPG